MLQLVHELNLVQNPEEERNLVAEVQRRSLELLENEMATSLVQREHPQQQREPAPTQQESVSISRPQPQEQPPTLPRPEPQGQTSTLLQQRIKQPLCRNYQRFRQLRNNMRAFDPRIPGSPYRPLMEFEPDRVKNQILVRIREEEEPLDDISDDEESPFRCPREN